MKLSRTVKILGRYLLGSPVAADLPSHVWIEPTNRCNLRCPMCPTGCRPGRTGEMSLDLYERIVGQLEGTSVVVYLHLAGEPLLHPDLPRMISLCREAGLSCGFFTNGTLLEPGLDGRILDAAPDWMGISFDGWDAASHESIRRGSRFDQTLSRIEGFLLDRRRRGVRRPHVTLSVIELPMAGGEAARAGLEALRLRLAASGLDEFQTTPAHRWAGAGVAEPGLVAPRGPDVPATTRCPFPWSGLAVRWDGTLVPCCIDLEGRMELGHVSGCGLREFWKGETMRDLRRRMALLDLSALPVCRDCHVVRQPRFLGVPSGVWRELADLLRVRRNLRS